jgi:hypothetical protein
MARRVMLPNCTWTGLSHDPEVQVKCGWHSRVFLEARVDLGLLVLVVQHDVQSSLVVRPW